MSGTGIIIGLAVAGLALNCWLWLEIGRLVERRRNRVNRYNL